MAVIVNPNNPTGTVFSTDEIYNFAKKYPSVFFIIDESFIEFSNQQSIMFKLIENNLDNVLIIKSLSKNLGVPGIRLGYVFSTNKEILNFILDRIPIWNTNSIAEFYLEIILKHKNDLYNSYLKTNNDRKVFAKLLKDLPFIENVYSSGGNYITVKFKQKPKSDILSLLISNYGVFVKDVSSKFNDNNYYLRFAVRFPDENKLMVKLLKNVY